MLFFYEKEKKSAYFDITARGLKVSVPGAIVLETSVMFTPSVVPESKLHSDWEDVSSTY